MKLINREALVIGLSTKKVGFFTERERLSFLLSICLLFQTVNLTFALAKYWVFLYCVICVGYLNGEEFY